LVVRLGLVVVVVVVGRLSGLRTGLVRRLARSTAAWLLCRRLGLQAVLLWLRLLEIAIGIVLVLTGMVRQRRLSRLSRLHL
jgi:hypothetical protein